MTIQEAIKSGKPFRRPCMGQQNGPNFWIAPTTEVNLQKIHILADDWEIKREPREMFLVHFNGAWRETHESQATTEMELGYEVIKVREIIE